MDFVPFIVALLQEMAFGSHAVEIVAGALKWLELDEWGDEMGVQKVLECDGWANPDMSQCACTMKQGLTGAESVCGAAGVGTGVGGELTRGSTLKQIPPWAVSLYSLHSVGFSCHWPLCLQGQQPLPIPQAAPLSAVLFRDQEGNSYFPGAEREGRRDPADLQLCCSPESSYFLPDMSLVMACYPLPDIFSGNGAVPIPVLRQQGFKPLATGRDFA